MRSNRKVRDQIEALHGPAVVDELSRWNDTDLDSLADHGIELNPLEEARQARVLQSLAGSQPQLGVGSNG